jgi:hypothetical protein
VSKEQTVTRSGKSRAARFARIDNVVLQHKDLSFRARGVLAYVLSMPDTWRHSAKSLSHASPDGMSAIRCAMRELDVAGFATLQKVREKGGRVVNRWIFRESPSAEKLHPVKVPPSTENSDPVEPSPSMRLPGPGGPDSGEPGLGGPGLGKPALLETTVSETTDSETTDKKTTGGVSKPPLPILFPFALFTELPAEMQTELMEIQVFDPYRIGGWSPGSELPSIDWWQTRLSEIRGRKLAYGDKRSLNEWLVIIDFELRKVVEAYKNETNTKSKGFGRVQTKNSRALKQSGVLDKVTDKDSDSVIYDAVGNPRLTPEHRAEVDAYNRRRE